MKPMKTLPASFEKRILGYSLLITAIVALVPLPDAAFDLRIYLPSIPLAVITVVGVYGAPVAAARRRIEAGAPGSLILRRSAAY
jgi:hypothetical protein